MASNASTAFAATGFSSTTTAGAAIVGTQGTNGLSLGVPAFLTTAQAPGAYLTTAMASNASTGFAGTGITTTTTAGTAIVGTHGTGGLSLGVPAFLTVAAGAGAALQGSGTYTQNSGTIAFANSNNITFGLTANQMTASFGGLTTAMQSNASTNFAGTGFTSTTTAGTAVVGTHNTAGLSMGFPAFVTNAITTGMASNAGSLFLNTGTTGATNASITVASNGLSVSVGGHFAT